MVNKILNELKVKLNELAKCKNECYISLGLNTKFATFNNVVKPDEIFILDDVVSIQSGHLNMNFNLDSSMKITKYDYGVENEYYISNKETELYISLLGT